MFVIFFSLGPTLEGIDQFVYFFWSSLTVFQHDREELEFSDTGSGVSVCTTN